MKKLLILLLPFFLVWCMEVPHKLAIPHQEGKSFEHTAFYQKLKNKALEKKYQKREKKYNIRDPFKNIYYREDNVPVIYMWRLSRVNGKYDTLEARTIADIYYSPMSEKWESGVLLWRTSGDYIYAKYPQERYVSIYNHSGWNLEEVAKSWERHVFSVTSASHPELEIYDYYSPVSERYIVE